MKRPHWYAIKQPKRYFKDKFGVIWCLRISDVNGRFYVVNEEGHEGLWDKGKGLEEVFDYKGGGTAKSRG